MAKLIKRTFAPRMFAVGKTLIAPHPGCVKTWKVIDRDKDTWARTSTFREAVRAAIEAEAYASRVDDLWGN